MLRKLLPASADYDFNIHVMDFKPGEFLNVKACCVHGVCAWCVSHRITAGNPLQPARLVAAAGPRHLSPGKQLVRVYLVRHEG